MDVFWWKKDKNIKYNLIDITKSIENTTKDFGKLQSKKENNCYEKLKKCPLCRENI